MLLTDCNAWVRVGRLDQLFALVSHHPVGIYLSGSLRIQVDHLELPEVCGSDGIVLWTHVKKIWNAVVIKVIFARVPSSIACKIKPKNNNIE